MSDIKESVVDLVGNTPLLRVNNLIKKYDLKADVLVKLESFNPAGSAKDRIAREMLFHALEKGIINKDIKMLQQDIRINEVYESEGNTYISFTSDEDLALNRTFLNIDGERKSVEKTITGDYDKIVNGDSVKVNYTRTIEFKGTGEDLELNIQRIRYGKTYDELIYKYNAKE